MQLGHGSNEVTQARRSRIAVSAGIVPGTRNVYAQALMTGALSLLIFSALLVIVSIDHPFAGSVRVDPEPLETVLLDLAGVPKA